MTGWWRADRANVGGWGDVGICPGIYRALRAVPLASIFLAPRGAGRNPASVEGMARLVRGKRKGMLGVAVGHGEWSLDFAQGAEGNGGAAVVEEDIAGAAGVAGVAGWVEMIH